MRAKRGHCYDWLRERLSPGAPWYFLRLDELLYGQISKDVPISGSSHPVRTPRVLLPFPIVLDQISSCSAASVKHMNNARYDELGQVLSLLLSPTMQKALP